MRKITLLLGTALMMLLPMKAWSQEAYTWLSSDGKTFTFCYDDQKESREGTTYGLSDSWYNDTKNVETVVFNSDFANVKPTSTKSWFSGMSKVKEIPTLGYLDTSNVTDMSGMFNGCNGLTSLDLSNFKTAAVTNMSSMFYYCRGLTSLDLSSFNTAAVTSMSSMFQGCYGLKSVDISSFDTKSVKYMSSMFKNCSSLTSLDLSHFNTASVTTLASMFFECYSLASVNLSNFNTAAVTDMSSMFESCHAITSLNLSSFNTESVTNMNSMFQTCMKLTSLNLSNFITSNVTDMRDMFRSLSALTSLNISNLNTEKIINMSHMFDGCSSLTSLDVSSLNTEKVTDMQFMFANCSKLKSLDLSNFNTSRVTTMFYMFGGCSYLKSLDLSNFNTAAVTDMKSMFYSCYSLKSIAGINNFNTARVKNMSFMFNYCSSLTDLDLSNFNTAAVTTMSNMFSGCNKLTSLDLSNFDLSNLSSSDIMLQCKNLRVLKISPSMENIANAACSGVGTAVNPCAIIAPEDFDFGVDTSGDYFQWKQGYFMLNPINAEITIPELGLATFCYDKDLDFSGVPQYKAYVVAGYNSSTGNVTLVRVTDVPAGTGLILKGTPGTYDLIGCESKSLYANYLIGTTEAVTIQPTEGDKTNLVLSSKNGKVGFYPIASAREVGANKAYLQLPTYILSANGMGLEFEDETTGIDGVEAVNTPDVVWYTIDGRKLDAKPTQKGLYIANGRKVVIP